MPDDDPESSTALQLKAANQNLEPFNKKVTPLKHTPKRGDLSLKIPSKPVYFGSNSNGKGPVSLESSSRGSSSARGLSQGPSFKNQVMVVDERTPLLNSDHDAGSDMIIPEDASLASYIAALTWKRCVSLPVTPATNMSPSVSISAGETRYSEQHPPHNRTIPVTVPRSLSVPVRSVVILRTASFSTPKEFVPTDTGHGQMTTPHLENGDEIPEDEAVCRICYEELCGHSSLKLECSCRGDLRLLHEECAVKWFGSRGNKKCDVCAQEILNLPVTLFRLQSSAQSDDRPQHVRQSSNLQLSRAWQDVVVLILISTMCYFFFLEQLLVDHMGSQAIVIAAPFSFSLGLLSSISAIFLARKDYVWSYSAFEFVLAVIFLHLFYSVLEVSAVYAILFASFMAFGIAMCLNSLILLIYARRARAVLHQMNSTPV